ncbi:aminoglycoside 6-adenylyltransferase [Streptococcus anginosus]|uniref:aminoglycoside 6-adenylyltransferase n=1 Tax=Streptococcus anginosus TaxID=1328 RepID=UPI0029C4DB13|nr:aminoglycoside 6-adenylyltransferase [Streptococcus anginosus]MDX5015343.1 aminoglycoside 6-adenylyltransferase [Streptococcus anginosus]MDX5019421.1 aminoglycoside 6-adenylyltransferase [Streptococcus anginosus]
MRTESEMLDLILRTAKVIQADSVALSGSRTNPNAPKDEFQDYDVVYIVDDLAAMVTDLAWLEAFGKRIIEQHNILDHRCLYLMLFEDGNRIDLTLCPKEHIKEWVDSEADFMVLDDPQGLFRPYTPTPKRYWTKPASADDFAKSCNEFWWVSAYVVKGIQRQQFVYAADHLYGICQKELLKLLAWQVAANKGVIDVGKNYKYLFQYLPAEKEEEFATLLDFSNKKSLIQSLLSTQQFFHKEAQAFSLKTGFPYDKGTAEKMIQYTKEKLNLRK